MGQTCGHATPSDAFTFSIRFLGRITTRFNSPGCEEEYNVAIFPPQLDLHTSWPQSFLTKTLSSSSPVEIALQLGQNSDSKGRSELKPWTESRAADGGLEGCDLGSPRCSLGLNVGRFQALS